MTAQRLVWSGVGIVALFRTIGAAWILSLPDGPRGHDTAVDRRP